MYKCPTWSWEGGDPSKRKKHLPAEKQYLVTRGVPCTSRVSSLENVVAVSQNLGGGIDGEGGGLEDDDGDWLVSQILTAEEQKKREEEALEDDFDILDDEGEVVGGVANLSLGGGEGDKSNSSAGNNDQTLQQEAGNKAVEEEDEYADMADFEDDNVMEDEAAVTSNSTPPSSEENNKNNKNVLSVRTYDLSITYDKYYQTPRIWLLGYSDDGTLAPLTGQEMMQDVISDYANKTVTIENHPHVSGPHASIHPCQHGAVMKTIVRNLTKEIGSGSSGEDNKKSEGPSVEMYLFIFLKFVSSMIPTINYDFTMDVSASTKK